MGEITFPESIDKEEIRQNYSSAMAELDAIVDGTSGLNTAQKLILFARILRWVLRVIIKILN